MSKASAIEQTDEGFRAWVERNEVELIVASLVLILATIALVLDKATSAQWYALLLLVMGYIFGTKR